MNRETWLNQLAAKMSPTFKEMGWPLPPFRVSIGFTSSGRVSNVGGECWHKSVSKDGVFEILIAPHQDEPMRVTAVLAHELGHAAVGFEHGHKGDFAKCMTALGMIRPFTSAVPGEKFTAWAAPMLAELSALPHAALQFDGSKPMKPKAPERGQDQDSGGEEAGEGGEAEAPASTRPPKQSARLKKCACGECGYTVRVTQKWLDIGPPHCPLHGPMDTPADE